MIKFPASDITNIISPLHNKYIYIYIYIYKCVGVCWISNNNTLDIPCTPNAQEARQQPFESDFTIAIPVV